MLGLPININELINGKVVEWERIEFKENWNPEKIIHTICAFANDINNWGGGYIFIGIQEEDGRASLPPKGLQQNQLDPIQRKLLQICHRITPNFFPKAFPYEYQGKQILVLWVPGGDNRPYKAPEKLKKGSPQFHWIRRYSNTVKPTHAEEQLLLSLSGKIPFDDRINHQADINDFQVTLITEYLAEVKSNLKIEHGTAIEEICSAMQIARGPEEYYKPLNIGLLFFATDPERFFPGAQIEVVEFLDDVGDNLLEKTFKGPIHSQVRSALRYIQNSIIKERVRKTSGKAEAERNFNYPYEAIEEALVNAVYHKSYDQRNPVEVMIRKDCIEILSYPGPLPPVDKNKLKKEKINARNYRNRRIGDFLKELKLTEGRGTGLPKIRKALRDNGSPDPVFETDDNATYFLAILFIHHEFISSLSQEVSLTGTQADTHVSTQVDTREFKVLDYCKTPHSREEVLVHLELKPHYKSFKRHVKPLIENGLIKLTIPDKPKSQNQKYVTTQKGLKIVYKE
ncbi:MAG: putative DNA binding domain-containing protein [Candidatus Cloacimonetes bacterium]|nr:putative DNA binding domain-containing protein [Candidatus Cloacimonadota bacterium]